MKFVLSPNIYYMLSRRPKRKRHDEEFIPDSSSSSDATDPDHQSSRPPSLAPPLRRQKKKRDIEVKIENLDDFIAFAENFVIKPDEAYSVNMERVKSLVPILKELQALIGLHDIKNTIVLHLMTMLSGLHNKDAMVHTAIFGPPGTGKTTVARILARIYQVLGFSNGKFKAVKRSDLVAGYLGQTTLKTQEVIDSIKGGVLFIDEAYALGDREGNDSYAKEIIDCLNQNLSERRNEFICIIAGYREELELCFFAQNPGLDRRFTHKYTIHPYTAHELREIFKHNLSKTQNWVLGLGLNNVLTELFKRHFKLFTNQGGDVEILIDRCRMAHVKRIFGRHVAVNKEINQSDLEEGFRMFLLVKEHSTNNNARRPQDPLKRLVQDYL